MILISEIISNPYITWYLNPHGICAYIIQRTNIIVNNEENCMTQKGYICNCKLSSLLLLL